MFKFLFITVCSLFLIGCNPSSKRDLSLDAYRVQNAWILTTKYIGDGSVSALSLSAYSLYKHLEKRELMDLYEEGSSIYGKIYLLSLISKHDVSMANQEIDRLSKFNEETLEYHEYGEIDEIKIEELLVDIRSGSFFEKCINMKGFTWTKDDIDPIYAGFIEESRYR